MVLQQLDDPTVDRVKSIIEDTGTYEILSLGGGVQSSALFIMNLMGEIEPRAEFAVFSDTGWERQATYDYLDYLDKLAEKYDYPKVMRVSAGNIRKDMLVDGDAHFDHMPLFTASGSVRGGMLRRQCTGYYKIRIIKREVRRLFGMRKRSQWIGFSMDEITRRNDDSFPKYITPRYPLLEKRMTRRDCLRWLLENGHPLPVKSSCVGCPYRKQSEWAEMKYSSPAEFKDACDFDDDIRDKHLSRPRVKTMQLDLLPDAVEEPTFDLYLHGSLTPLKVINFSDVEIESDLFNQQLTPEQLSEKIDTLLEEYEAEDGEHGCSDAEGGCHL